MELARTSKVSQRNRYIFSFALEGLFCSFQRALTHQESLALLHESLRS